jgi:hypothetical protein
MRLVAALQGDLNRIMAEELATAETAVTAGVAEITDELKTTLRRQVTSAGLGSRLANTWRSEVYPKRQKSIAAAGFIWSKAPKIIGAYDRGVVIRSTRGLYLAIPLPPAGKYGLGRKKITPSLFERTTGLPLRFVYRRGAPSLLVVDNARLTKSGRARANIGRHKGATFTRLAGRATVPVFLLVPQVSVRKRLDVAGAARSAEQRLADNVLRHWKQANG